MGIGGLITEEDGSQIIDQEWTIENGLKERNKILKEKKDVENR